MEASFDILTRHAKEVERPRDEPKVVWVQDPLIFSCSIETRTQIAK